MRSETERLMDKLKRRLDKMADLESSHCGEDGGVVRAEFARKEVEKLVREKIKQMEDEIFTLQMLLAPKGGGM